MSKFRWIKLFLVLGLVMVLFIATLPTTNTSAAFARPESLSKQNVQVAAGPCYLTKVEIHSIHLGYLKGQNTRILETDNGPLGYDGGLSAMVW